MYKKIQFMDRCAGGDVLHLLEASQQGDLLLVDVGRRGGRLENQRHHVEARVGHLSVRVSQEEHAMLAPYKGAEALEPDAALADVLVSVLVAAKLRLGVCGDGSAQDGTAQGGKKRRI